MIPNCKGCKYDFYNALFNQEKCDCFVATSIKHPLSYPNGRHHLCLIIVDNEGKIIEL